MAYKLAPKNSTDLFVKSAAFCIYASYFMRTEYGAISILNKRLLQLETFFEAVPSTG